MNARLPQSGLCERTAADCRAGFAQTLVVLLLAGACFVMAFPPIGFWPLSALATLLTGWAAWNASSRRSLAVAAFIGWGAAWVWLQWWIVDVSVLGGPALMLYMTVWSLLHVFVLRRLARHGVTRRLPMALLLPVSWIGLETLRANLVFDGYPWYLVGHPLVEAPVLVQSADLLGVPLVGVVATCVAGAALDFTLRGRLTLRTRRLAVLVATLMVLATIGYGSHRLRTTDALAAHAGGGSVAPGEIDVAGRATAGAALGPRILAIQTNLATSNKIAWTPEQQVKDFLAFRRQTIDAFTAEIDANGSDGIPDLVVWPETMLPTFGLEPETIQALVDGEFYPGDNYARAIVELAGMLRRPLLVGSAAYLGLRPNDEPIGWDRHYNSAYLLTPGAANQRYDKVFLTPFGETMPYISAFPALEKRLLDLGANGMSFDLDVGGSTAPLRVVGGRGDWNIATPICFEDTVPWLCREMIFEGGRKRADLFVNLSNDGWFGAIDAGRLQHAQIARFRCIENRVPMVRTVNTGVTIAIDSAGRLVGAVGGAGYGTPRIAGWLGTQTILDDRVTLYARVGDLLGWVAATLMAIGLVAGACFGKARAPSAPAGGGPAHPDPEGSGLSSGPRSGLGSGSSSGPDDLAARRSAAARLAAANPERRSARGTQAPKHSKEKH